MRSVLFFGKVLKPKIDKANKVIVLTGGAKISPNDKRMYLSMSDIKNGYRDYEIKFKL